MTAVAGGALTAAEAVAGTKVAIGVLGKAYMVDAATYQRGQALGFTGLDFYMTGRLGVLGAPDADVVAASAVFVHPDGLRALWDMGVAVMPVEEAVGHWAEACRAWGRARYADDTDTARLADLLERLVDAADGYGRPLFAGWRRVPRCADGPGRVNQAIHVLRERRGGTHDIAVLAQGLRPLEAMAARGEAGLQSAVYFGWQPPYPDGAPFEAAYREAERVTDQLEAPVYEALEPDERAELAALLARAERQAQAFTPA